MRAADQDPTSGGDLRETAVPQKAGSAQNTPTRAGLSVFGLGVVAIGVVALMGLRLSNGVMPWDHSPDTLSQAARDARTAAFLAAPPIELQRVPSQERPDALASMSLDSQSEESLRTATSPGSAPEHGAPSVRLAWLTLWDTDDEDGDVVRIDSAGYSRTVSLTKKPITFAVPVPTDGIINITGVRDGEGGGITVGAASQTSQVVLPIMSVGQVVGLHVRTR